MIGALLNLVIWLLIFGILYGLVIWLIANIPIPEPFANWARIIIVVIAALAVISILLSLAGVSGGFDLPRIVQ
jgi:small basic protein